MTSRFFYPEGLEGCVDLPEAIAHHAARVLRMSPGDALVLFDGHGREAAAVIESVARGVRVQVGAFREVSRESTLNITLYQALSTADKMDWVVQKAVELGVTAIVPVCAERSVLRLSGDRAAKRVAHWQEVAISACAQCGRNRVPNVADIAPLPAALAACGADIRLILAPGGGTRLSEMPLGPAQADSLALFVGPEGGWSAGELTAAQAAGLTALQLGPRVLRTETAGLAALAALAALHGDF